jgi:vacuolar-type H+-ATPase subunit I/STV1
MNSNLIQAQISVGELLDKITILEIKRQRITDAGKLDNVERELAVLSGVVAEFVTLDQACKKLMDELREVNSAIWDVEDAIRECERGKDFSDVFVQLARSVYIKNDRRALLKKQINEYTGSLLVEEKSYADYGADAQGSTSRQGSGG